MTIYLLLKKNSQICCTNKMGANLLYHHHWFIVQTTVLVSWSRVQVQDAEVNYEPFNKQHTTGIYEFELESSISHDKGCVKVLHRSQSERNHSRHVEQKGRSTTEQPTALICQQPHNNCTVTASPPADVCNYIVTQLISCWLCCLHLAQCVSLIIESISLWKTCSNL